MGCNEEAKIMKTKLVIALSAFFLLLPTSCDHSSGNSSDNGNLWAEPAKSVLNTALKNYDIPVFQADEYYAETNDSYGVTMAVINCMGGFDESAAELIYTLSLKSEGYEIDDLKEEEGCIYGVKEVVPDTLAIVVQYAYLEKYANMQRYSYFAIIAYLYENPNQQNPVYESWPSQEIKLLLGDDIPSYENATKYEIISSSTLDGEFAVDIYCYEAQNDAETVYSSIVSEAGYVIEEHNGLYYATNNELSLQLIYYMSYDNTFFIRADRISD